MRPAPTALIDDRLMMHDRQHGIATNACIEMPVHQSYRTQNADGGRAESGRQARARSIGCCVNMSFVIRQAHSPRSSATGGGCSTRTSGRERSGTGKEHSRCYFRCSLLLPTATLLLPLPLPTATSAVHCTGCRSHFQTPSCLTFVSFVSCCACSSPTPAIRTASAV